MTEEIEVRVPRKVDARVAEEIGTGVTADIEVQVGEPALGAHWASRHWASQPSLSCLPRPGSSMRSRTGDARASCSSSCPSCPRVTRSGSASGVSWSSCTCRWWNTWPGDSVTAANGSTT